MQRRSSVSTDVEAPHTDCAFCQIQYIDSYILQDSPNFRIVTDHAPLVEGHLLIIPKTHYACYGTVPATLDQELLELKQTVQQFFTQFYAAPIYWEHGVFHQTVFHAHLHCFPFGDMRYSPNEGLHKLIVQNQDDLRHWYTHQGHYFYMADTQQAFLFAPEMSDYTQIVREALSPGVAARNPHPRWRTPEERREAGRPLIQALEEKWQAFQQQEKE